jgi:hypothetical protein
MCLCDVNASVKKPFFVAMQRKHDRMFNGQAYARADSAFDLVLVFGPAHRAARPITTSL